MINTPHKTARTNNDLPDNEHKGKGKGHPITGNEGPEGK
jgi:hypothetical protein